MTGGHDEDSSAEEPVAPTPWHHSTPAVIGASVAGLAAIALVVGIATVVTRQFSEPESAPIDYVDPTFSSRASNATSVTSTTTITSTSPPVTTDINIPPTTPTTPGPSDTASPSPTTSPTTSPPETTPAIAETIEPEEPEETEKTEETRTTRNRPRTNVTRTLYPLPDN